MGVVFRTDSGTLHLKQVPRTAIGAAAQTSDQIELERVETPLLVEHGIVDMCQQYLGKDQVAVGPFRRIRLDLRHTALEGHRCSRDARHVDTFARQAGNGR